MRPSLATMQACPIQQDRITLLSEAKPGTWILPVFITRPSVPFHFIPIKTGARNTAIGTSSQYWNTANDNTALGFESLNQKYERNPEHSCRCCRSLHNQISNDNTAIGDSALYSNISFMDGIQQSDLYHFDQIPTGMPIPLPGPWPFIQILMVFDNTAAGYSALYSNTTGSYNTVSGAQAMSRQYTRALTIQPQETGAFLATLRAIIIPRAEPMPCSITSQAIITQPEVLLLYFLTTAVVPTWQWAIMHCTTI